MNALDADDRAPIFLAITKKDYEMVTNLLELGSDRDFTDKNGTKLDTAAENSGDARIMAIFRSSPSI